MVLAAHRFLYTSGPKTFYYLDRLQIGDQFSIVWNGVPHTYGITSIQVVSSQAVEIEKPTLQPTVTLYTCTPLWSSSHRLVVTATPLT